MRILALLFVLYSTSAFAQLDLTWRYLDDPIVCTQNESCDVRIELTREATSTADFPVTELCDGGMNVAPPSDLKFTPFMRSGNPLCELRETLTAQSPVSSVLTIGRLTDPGTASVQTYNLSINLSREGVNFIEPPSVIISVEVDSPVVPQDADIRLTFNEGTGTLAADSSGNGNDGTLVNGTAWATFGTVYDGTNDYVSLGNYDPDVTGGLTSSIWITSDDFQSCTSWDCRIIMKGDGTSEGRHWFMLSAIRFDQGLGDIEAPRVRLKVDDGGVLTTHTLIVDSGAFVNGVEVHAVVTATVTGTQPNATTEVKLYLDNVLQTFSTSGVLQGIPDTDATIPFALGGIATDPTARPFDGTLKKFEFWTRVLTDQERTDLFAEGNGDSPPPQLPPTANDDACSTLVNTLVDCIVLVNDTGFAPLALDSVTTPFNGTAAVNGSLARYTPDTDFVGTDGFDYVVSNSLGTDTGTVTVTISAPGSAYISARPADDRVTIGVGVVGSVPTAACVVDNPVTVDNTTVENCVLGSPVASVCLDILASNFTMRNVIQYCGGFYAVDFRSGNDTALIEYVEINCSSESKIIKISNYLNITVQNSTLKGCEDVFFAQGNLGTLTIENNYAPERNGDANSHCDGIQQGAGATTNGLVEMNGNWFSKDDANVACTAQIFGGNGTNTTLNASNNHFAQDMGIFTISRDVGTTTNPWTISNNVWAGTPASGFFAGANITHECNRLEPSGTIIPGDDTGGCPAWPF